MAIVGLLAAVSLSANIKGQDELVNAYAAIGEDYQSRIKFGWVPGDIYKTDRFEGTKDAEADTPARESLRRTYRRKYLTGEPECPPLVRERDACDKNYVFVVSASWCAPCRKMYPVIDKLRKDGYLVFYYDIDKYPDLDARFDVTSYPTFIVYDKGKEQSRAVGIVPETWFTERLKKRSEQVDPVNPYDELIND